MRVRVSELSGPSLNWAVAKCEGYTWEPETFYGDVYWHGPKLIKTYKPSTDWSQGGPIIDRERINLQDAAPVWWAEFEHLAADDEMYRYGGCYGPTPLVAAMRCYVASKLGEEVDVPDELA